MTSPRRLAALLLCGSAALAAPGPAKAQEGRIVERDTVQYSAEWRARVAPLARRELGIELDSLLSAVVVQRITYLSDGLRVRGYLVEPLGGATQLPAVIYNRGGNREGGALNDGSAARTLAAIAQRGYVVVASQYRGNAGGEGKEEFGGADVNDVLNLIPLLAQHPRADTSRIGMVGHSRGGMMTFLALTRTDRIRGAVAIAPAVDLVNISARPDTAEMVNKVYAELIPGFRQDRERVLRARSAVFWPERLSKRTPLLLLQGSADWRADPANALQMARALYGARHPFRLVFFEGADHGLTEVYQEQFSLMMDWLDRYVRDRAPLPNLQPHGS